MTDFLQKHRLVILGVLLGGVAGYCYYYFVGCSTGSCAITSKPINSTIYGMFMGYLLFSIFEQPKSKKNA